uniref:Uncharacterized protein n=1 Tax=Populus trichocarpa TaxID=3694 RepID=A0A3N7F4R1_POPTR
MRGQKRQQNFSRRWHCSSASLNQELQDMEALALRGQNKSPEEANQMIQIQAWQEEVERSRQGQRDAESKLSYFETEVQKMRVEMAAMKRDAEHYSRQEHMELEKRYRELTDLLYYKQTQLEAMASEKAAAEFQLEKKVKRLQEAQQSLFCTLNRLRQKEVEFPATHLHLGKKTLK